jgi:dihydrofolate reductase
VGDLIYSMGVSLDGYAEDAQGGFGWSAPDDEVHALANRDAREASAFVFGRRMYETLDDHWMRAAQEEGHPPVEAEFAAAYAATPRYVVSDSLEAARNGATLVRRAQARDTVERLTAESGTHVGVGGPAIAASLVDLIDEFRMWMSPVAVGGGTPFFPAGAAQLDLRLVECRPFPSGTLWLRYRRR